MPLMFSGVPVSEDGGRAGVVVPYASQCVGSLPRSTCTLRSSPGQGRVPLGPAVEAFMVPAVRALSSALSPAPALQLLPLGVSASLKIKLSREAVFWHKDLV